MSGFIHQFSYNLYLLLIIFIIGSLVVRLISFEFPTNSVGFFLVVAAVLCFVVTLGAAYYTGFRTILLGPPILFFVYLYFRSKSVITTPSKKLDKQLFFEWFIVHIVVFGIYYYVSNAVPSDFFNIPSRDMAFYARSSYQLVDKGIETHTFNPFYQELNQLEPYHYFDLWLNGIVSKVTGNNNLLNIFYVIYPLGVSVTWLGICAILSLFKNLTRLDKILAFGGTMVVGSILPITISFSEFMNNASSWQLLADTPPGYLLYNLWYFPKLFPVYWGVAVSLVFLIQKNIKASIFSLLCLCFYFTPTAPAIVMGIMAFILLRPILIQKWDKTMESIVAMCLFTIAFIAFFYWMLQPAPVIHNVGPEEHLFKMIKRGIRYLFDASLQTLNVYILWVTPLLIGLFATGLWKKLWKDYKEAILFVTALSFAGMFAWGFFRAMQDADQMYTNFGLVILNLTIAVSYIVILGTLSNKVSRLTLTVVFVGLCYFSFSPNLRYGSNFYPEKLYSDQFLAEVEKIAPQLSRLSAFAFSKEDYQKPIHAEVEVLGQYLSLFRSDLTPVSLSIFNMPIFLKPNTPLPEGLSNHPFYKFVEEQKSTGKFVDLEKCKCDLIQKFKINHIIVKNIQDVPTCLKIERTINDLSSNQILVLVE